MQADHTLQTRGVSVSTGKWLLFGLATLTALIVAWFVLVGKPTKASDPLERQVQVCVVDSEAYNYGDKIMVPESEADRYKDPDDPACEPGSTPTPVPKPAVTIYR